MTRWLRLALQAALAAALVGVGAPRATVVNAAGCNLWTGGGTSANWSESANWSMGAPVSGQSLCFPATSPGLTLHDDIAGLSVTGLEFTGGADVVNGVSLGVAGSIAASGGSAHTLDMSNALTLSGAVTVQGSILLRGPLSGAGSLNIKGPSQVDLYSAANTFAGGVTIDGATGGDLYAMSFGPGPITVGSGALLGVLGNMDNPLSIGGTGPLGSFALICFNGSHLGGPITLTANTVFFSYLSGLAHTCRVDGAITGGFQLTLEDLPHGAPTSPGWILNGDNTYSGGTRISGPGYAAGSVSATGGSPLGTGPVVISPGVATLPDVGGPTSQLFATGALGALTLDAPQGTLDASDGSAHPER